MSTMLTDLAVAIRESVARVRFVTAVQSTHPLTTLTVHTRYGTYKISVTKEPDE